MDYSQLSDFEINKRVAIATGQNIKFIFLDDDDNEIGVLVGRKGCREKKDFDPCNNPADAWPVIDDSNIALIPSEGFGWVAVSDLTLNGKSSYIDERLGDCFQHEDCSGLRAAMIVYLMMQDAKHA